MLSYLKVQFIEFLGFSSFTIKYDGGMNPPYRKGTCRSNISCNN
jgi:hypothetical protein